MKIKTVWTDAHMPKVNKYLLNLETDPKNEAHLQVHYTEVIVNGKVESFRIEDMRGGLITDGHIIGQVCAYISKNPGPPK
jgi:hypothetical protein